MVVGDVASSASAYFHFAKKAWRGLKDPHIRIRLDLRGSDRSEKTGSSAADNGYLIVHTLV